MARDRRASRFTFELLEQLLELPGKILHIQTDHKCGTVAVYFEGDGSFQIPEGAEAVVRTPDAWRRADLERELKNGNRTGRGDIVPHTS